MPPIDFTHQEVLALLWVYGECDDRPSPALASAVEKLNVSIKGNVAGILNAEEEKRDRAHEEGES